MKRKSMKFKLGDDYLSVFYLMVAFYYYFTFVFKSFRMLNYVFIYFLPLLYLLYHKDIIINILKDLLKSPFKSIFLILLFVFSFSVFSPILHATFDFTYMNKYLSLMRNGIKMVFLLVLFINLHEKFDYLLFVKYFILSCVIYIAFTSLMLIFPVFKEFWSKLIWNSSLDIINSNKPAYATRYGLVGFSGFRQTFTVSLAALFNVYLLMLEKGSSKSNAIYSITLIILFIGNSFYGRIGLMTTSFFILIMLIYFLFVSTKKFIIILSIIAGLLSIFFVIMSFNSSIYSWFNWSFAMFKSFFEKGTLVTGSANKLFKEMFFKLDLKTFLIGEGYYTDPNTGSYYMLTDSGLMRPTLFFGIIGTISNYLLISVELFLVTIKMKSQKTKDFYPGLLLVLMMIIILLVFELKGEIFYLMFPLILPFVYIFALPKEHNKEIVTSVAEGGDNYE